jgi:hypothetical protein
MVNIHIGARRIKDINEEEWTRNIYKLWLLESGQPIGQFTLFRRLKRTLVGHRFGGTEIVIRYDFELFGIRLCEFVEWVNFRA